MIGVEYIERVVRLGPDLGLAGVFTEPAVASPGKRPIVVMWNVGLNHHVGPYRIYVDLARRLAAAGTSALRFDLSGLGDSESAPEDLRNDGQRSVGDVLAALTSLEATTGPLRAILVGFCSSVDSAHAAALQDRRVVGLINIEGYSFPTRGYRMRYAMRLLDRNRWMRWLYHRQRWASGEARDSADYQGGIYERDYPTPAKLQRDYRSMVDRGVQLLCVYVRGDSRYEYREQIFEFLADASLARSIDVEFYPEADHVFATVDDRASLVARIVGFVEDKFTSQELE